MSHILILKRLCLVKGNEIWTTGCAEVSSVGGKILEEVVHIKPCRNPNINVEVICEFDYMGRTPLVQAKSQLINRRDQRFVAQLKVFGDLRII